MEKKTLIEQAFEINERSNKMCDENPGMTGTWWEINDASIEEMRALQNETHKMFYLESRKQMAFQPHFFLNGRVTATIFAFSKEVQVKEHIVIGDVMINV